MACTGRETENWCAVARQSSSIKHEDRKLPFFFSVWTSTSKLLCSCSKIHMPPTSHTPPQDPSMLHRNHFIAPRQFGCMRTSEHTQPISDPVFRVPRQSNPNPKASCSQSVRQLEFPPFVTCRQHLGARTRSPTQHINPRHTRQWPRLCVLRCCGSPRWPLARPSQPEAPLPCEPPPSTARARSLPFCRRDLVRSLLSPFANAAPSSRVNC
jgi:hypothetical protein